MIVYFADRQLSILGQASTKLPKGLTIIEDLKTEDVETGVAVFECKVPFDNKNRFLAEVCTEVGNYVLLNDNGDNELYTIIEAEIDTKNQEIYIYAEDGGMDLLNEVVGAYEADKAYPISHYINKYATGAGFQIGINEAASLTRKLIWDGEATAAERIASVATQFDGCEVSYSFEVDGLAVTKKFINIYKERGKDVGQPLRLNQEVDRIVTIKSIANLATALQCIGGTPDPVTDEETGESIDQPPVTLEGYKYDDGDFYVDGTLLKSRQALKRWSRYLWRNDQGEQAGGHIVKQFSYDTLNQQTLCAYAITELKKIRDMEVNYEADINKLPDNTKVGDRIHIVDDDGNLYLSTRILKLETSRVDQTCKATLGEFLIKESGISAKIVELAAQFAASSRSVARAASIASNALGAAYNAQSQAGAVSSEVASAQRAAVEAAEASDVAREAALNAQTQAGEAASYMGSVQTKITSLETTVNAAKLAADNAELAASTAERKAEQAATAAANAQADATRALNALGMAQNEASVAMVAAEGAQAYANEAMANASAAQATAEAAKADALLAQQEFAALMNSLVSTTSAMELEYARKSELTEMEASLGSQISQNAAQISLLVSEVITIDETANDAKDQAEAAQTAASNAQTQAGQAMADAQAAQTAADEAAAAAAAAQNEADTAKAAAATAKSVADKAEADLAAAKADLATVSSRVDATEEEIIAAQQAVEAAQSAAEKAKTDADTAVTKAAEAQSKANTAAANANSALTTANSAASQASLAQKVADEAKGDATTAKNTAEQAANVAAEAQRVANTAKTNAATAQETANKAVADAASAQAAANDADAKANQAAADLETAKQNLENVTSRVDATEEEVEAAQAAVATAQTAANRAQEEAEAAQSTANTAKANAATAQTVANNAKTAADNAQAAADEAQEAADAAQTAVNALAVRVTTAETKITQNKEQIALMAKKSEVEQTLGGYFTKEETEAKIQLESDSIISTVSGTYATSERVTTSESLIQQLSNCIEMLVTDENGESLMTQTENGWTFSMKETAEAVSGLSDLLETLQQESGGTKSTVGILQQAITDYGKTLEYVNVKTYEDEPCIELGESDSNFKLLITNTRIMFMNGGNIPTYINTNGIVTQDIEVQGEIVQGGYVMLNTADGGWGLLWKGVSS